MAELTDTTTIREGVRERYAAAARAVAENTTTGCCGNGVKLTDERGEQVFGGSLYDTAEAAEAPEAAVTRRSAAVYRPPSPTFTRARRCSISARAPAPT